MLLFARCIVRAVRQAEIALANDPAINKEYLPIDGIADLKEVIYFLNSDVIWREHAATGPFATCFGVACCDRLQLTQNLLFGPDSLPVVEKRVASVQALSGTGGLRLVADFFKHFLKQCRVGFRKAESEMLMCDTSFLLYATFELSFTQVVYVSNPTWFNHVNIFGAAAGLEIREYPYWEQVCLLFLQMQVLGSVGYE